MSTDTEQAGSLTVIERESLVAYEETITRGMHTFVEVGNALAEIRDGRLYREYYSTFEDYCRERWEMSKTQANRLIGSACVVESLTPIGVILPATESQARPLTAIPMEQVGEVWQEAVDTAPRNEKNEPVITAKHVSETVERRKGADKITPHVARNTGNNEWYTPPEFIEAARGVMGGIDLDPASSEIAQQTVQAAKFFTADDDGLRHPWKARVWLNPPYSSDLCPKFVEKLCEHIEAEEVWEAILLVNNATETRWFQRAARLATAICFPSSRIKFLNEDGDPIGAPLQGQAIFYFGEKGHVFATVFSRFGLMMSPLTKWLVVEDVA